MTSLILAAALAASTTGTIETPVDAVIEDINREPPSAPRNGRAGRILGVGSPGRRGPAVRDTDRGVPSGTVLELSTSTHRVDPARPRLRPQEDQSR